MSEQGKRGDLEFGTIPGMLRIAAERYAERNAVEDGDVTLTFPALRAEVQAVEVADRHHRSSEAERARARGDAAHGHDSATG